MEEKLSFWDQYREDHVGDLRTERQGILVGKYIFSESCVEVLTLAVDEMYKLGQSYLMPVHLFLAILLNSNVQFVEDKEDFYIRLYRVLEDRLYLFEQGCRFFAPKPKK